ncbi:MAG TPA: DUF934 domain-containing protein [Bordetella sp.]
MPDAPIATAPAPSLIRNGGIEADAWQVFQPTENSALPADEAGWIVPLPAWLSSPAALRARRHPVGVLLPSDTELKDWAGEAGKPGKIDFTGIAFIAVDFPVYTDGRGYTLAQQLRRQYGYAGELRAVGDVLIDTIHYQARVGFDSFLVKPGHDPAKALAALHTFSVHYQKAYRVPA